MEINLYLTLEKSLTVKGVDLFNKNNDEKINSFDMKYKDSWSQTFTCAKCKLLEISYRFLKLISRETVTFS